MTAKQSKEILMCEIGSWVTLAVYIVGAGYFIGGYIREAMAKPAGLELKVLAENRDSALINIQGDDYCLRYDSKPELEDYSKCECK